ncbi:MAG: hypothetical protein ACJ8GN_23660 [Longimicrobiaceae bacterium]
MASRVPVNLSVRDQLVRESIAMAQYALAAGMQVSPAAAITLEQARTAPEGTTADIGAITKVHDQLTRLVAPATPRALMLMGSEHGTGLRAMLGPVGLVRRMMVAAVISMVVFIAVSLTKSVNESQTVLNSSGWKLLWTELFWLSAAAMGASFAMLMQVSGYVVKRNYDPRYEPSYWIKFFLGVMAGFILVTLVPFEGAQKGTLNLAQPTFAMLGGFSASAVFRILTRLVDAVESIFRGDTKQEISRAESEARSKAGEEASQVRMGLAAQVVQLQQEVSAGADPNALTARLREILADLVPATAADVPAPAEPEPAPAPEPVERAPEGTIALPGVPVVAG